MGKRSNKAIALGAVPLVAAAFIAGCGDDDETAYCTDENDVVVDNSYCDDDFNNNGGGGVFFWAFVGGGTSYGRGQKISKAASKIASTNKSALAQKGGFGSKSGASGVGRSVSSSSSSSSRSGGG